MMTILKRLIQLLRIGSATRRVRDSRDADERLRAQRALANILADARGISMKVGQLFATSDGESPYQPLLNNVPAVPLKKILPVISAAIGRPLKQVFKDIQPSNHAASLGQVHFAKLLDNTPVAIKIRYPGIDAAVASELTLAGLLPGIGTVKKWGFDIESYKRQLNENMQRELDYLSEAQRQQDFKNRVKIDGLSVPDVYASLCNNQILVQSRAFGVTLDALASWSVEDKQRIAEILLRTLLQSLFVFGEVHADPHAGNYLFDHDANGLARVNLLDFGCTVIIEKTRRLALLKLILACREQSPISPLDCFAALGFDSDKLNLIKGALPALCHILFRPYMNDWILNPNDWHLERDISHLLDEQRWWFRSAGPADLLFIMRAFQGLLLQLQYLQVALPWWQILMESVDEDTIYEARNLILPVITERAPRFSTQAKKLKVTITAYQEELVNVSLPAEAVLELEQLIPEEIQYKLKQNQEFSMAKLMLKFRNQGILPQIIFEHTGDSKTYKVWLE